jgi:hypothetical protein
MKHTAQKNLHQILFFSPGSVHRTVGLSIAEEATIRYGSRSMIWIDPDQQCGQALNIQILCLFALA